MMTNEGAVNRKLRRLQKKTISENPFTQATGGPHPPHFCTQRKYPQTS